LVQRLIDNGVRPVTHSFGRIPGVAHDLINFFAAPSSKVGGHRKRYFMLVADALLSRKPEGFLNVISNSMHAVFRYRQTGFQDPVAGNREES
jgi:hypothetical protein